MYTIKTGKGKGYIPNVGPMWESDTRGPVARRQTNQFGKVDGNGLILIDPEQKHGPVYHLVVNGKPVGKEECTGPRTCKHCKATARVNKVRAILTEMQEGEV